MSVSRIHHWEAGYWDRKPVNHLISPVLDWPHDHFKSLVCRGEHLLTSRVHPCGGWTLASRVRIKGYTLPHQDFTDQSQVSIMYGLRFWLTTIRTTLQFISQGEWLVRKTKQQTHTSFGWNKVCRHTRLCHFVQRLSVLKQPDPSHWIRDFLNYYSCIF